MRRISMHRVVIMVAAVFACGGRFQNTADASIDFIGTPYVQNFDTLATSGSPSWANDSTLSGWYLFRRPAPGTAITSIIAGNGGQNDGSFYSFGTGTNTDRALGGLGSGGAYFGSPATGAVAGWIALALNNDTSDTISMIDISYDGEQWRNGGNTSAQTMVMEYGFGATFDAVSTWTAAGASLNFTSPTVGASAAALDGNHADNRAGLSGSISSLDWNVGEVLWLRWIEVNDSGNDHGLAIDNFRLSVTAAVVPELPTFYACSGLLGMVGLYGLSSALFKRRRIDAAR